MLPLQLASKRCNALVEKTLAWLGMSLALIILTQVFCRYILNHSLFWSEEMARYILVWLSFLGASSGYYRKVHPSIDVITQHFSTIMAKRSRILVYLLSLFLFLVMIYQGIYFAFFVRHQISPALAIPKWIIASVIPLSGALFLLHGLAHLAAEFWEVPHDH